MSDSALIFDSQQRHLVFDYVLNNIDRSSARYDIAAYDLHNACEHHNTRCMKLKTKTRQHLCRRAQLNQYEMFIIRSGPIVKRFLTVTEWVGYVRCRGRYGTPLELGCEEARLGGCESVRFYNDGNRPEDRGHADVEPCRVFRGSKA